VIFGIIVMLQSVNKAKNDTKRAGHGGDGIKLDTSGRVLEGINIAKQREFDLNAELSPQSKQ
jgi:hypothetical protein